ncbi:MAG: hypothetical protein AB7D35_06700 [Bacteroidales bacterium]
MKRSIHLFVFMLSLFLLVGCRKSPGDCFTSTGEITKEMRRLEQFNSIKMLDNIDVELVSGNSSMLEVSAGKKSARKN